MKRTLSIFLSLIIFTTLTIFTPQTAHASTPRSPNVVTQGMRTVINFNNLSDALRLINYEYGGLYLRTDGDNIGVTGVPEEHCCIEFQFEDHEHTYQACRTHEGEAWFTPCEDAPIKFSHSSPLHIKSLQGDLGFVGNEFIRIEKVWVSLTSDDTGIFIHTPQPLSQDRAVAVRYDWHTPELLELSLQPAIFAPVTPEIKTLASEIVASLGDDPTDYQIAKAMFSWVIANIRYDITTMFSSESVTRWKQRADIVIDTRLAVCDGYSNLLVALLHAENIPARKVLGYVGRRNINAFHAWVDTYIEGRWIVMDPTFGSSVNESNPSKFFDLSVFQQAFLLYATGRACPTINVCTGWLRMLEADLARQRREALQADPYIDRIELEEQLANQRIESINYRRQNQEFPPVDHP
jgi:transglutaminase-like putative cysteine protease